MCYPERKAQTEQDWIEQRRAAHRPAGLSRHKGSHRCSAGEGGITKCATPKCSGLCLLDLEEVVLFRKLKIGFAALLSAVTPVCIPEAKVYFVDCSSLLAAPEKV